MADPDSERVDVEVSVNGDRVAELLSVGCDDVAEVVRVPDAVDLSVALTVMVLVPVPIEPLRVAVGTLSGTRELRSSTA